MAQRTISQIRAMKDQGHKISAVTAYDYPSAKLADGAGIDLILVGDSLGAVVQGHATTLQVTMDQMIYHTAMVSRAVDSALVVGDMPFMSYQASVADALTNGGRFLAEAGATAIKIEGGGDDAVCRIKVLVTAGIPVMGHIGLTPQSVHAMGGYRVQGKQDSERKRLIAEARAVQDAGAFSMILEGIPEQLGKQISDALEIPTIGIGAGVHCDGQILVWHDLLGIGDGNYPKFVKPYAHLAGTITDALTRYRAEVADSTFPGPENTYH